ncbi:MAG: glycosyltransferase, partial [Calditrichota bacterium]
SIVPTFRTIYQRKNQRFLVDIAAEMNMLGKRWKYVVIGPDNNEEAHYLRQKISDFKLESQFHLLGEQDRTSIFTLLRQADLYFQTSKSESFGIALLEAIANDTLVLAMDYPALDEIMPQSDHTRFDQNMSAREVAAQIAELDNDVHLYREMRHQQFLHFAIQFAPELMRDRYVTLYRGLIEESAIPQSLFENNSSFFYTSEVESR